MSRCTVCPHAERSRAELLLAGGASLHSVARKFGVGYHALRRHWIGHVSEARKAQLALGPVEQAALAARVCEQSESVIDHLASIRAGLYQIFASAVEAGDRNGTALLAGRLHENLSQLARLTGQLASSPLIGQQINVFMSPQFVELQATLIRVLAAHPAARDDVIRAFRELEQRAGPPAAVPILEHRRHVIDSTAAA